MRDYDSASTAVTTCNFMQVRAVLYTFTLTNTLMESVSKLEQAVVAALTHQASPWPCDRRPLAGHIRHLTPQERMARWAYPRRGHLRASCPHSGQCWAPLCGISPSVQHSTLPARCHLLMQGGCGGGASA